MGEQRFVVGDRVLLKPSESWLQPWRAMADEKRGATVAAIVAWGKFKIAFDVKRKGAKPRELWCSPGDLEALATLGGGE